MQRPNVNTNGPEQFKTEDPSTPIEFIQSTHKADDGYEQKRRDIALAFGSPQKTTTKQESSSKHER